MPTPSLKPRILGPVAVVPALLVFALIAAALATACENALPPVSCGSLPEQTIHVGESATVSVCFDDPNEDLLAFTTTSSDPGVATATGTGGTVTVTAVSPGVTVVTIVATDPGGLQARQSFRVVVPNRPPDAVGRIPDQEVMVGDSVTLELAPYFNEPDGQSLNHAVAVSDSSRVRASVEGARVTLATLAKGTVTVIVTARDPGGLSAGQSFTVTVPNRGPVAVDSIAPLTLGVGRTETLSLVRYFEDPDGDPLSYVVVASDSSVVAVALSGDSVRLRALAAGNAMVTVTASDEEGASATQSFRVVVPNRPPRVASAIRDAVLFTDDTMTVTLSRHFSDPDGDTLAYTAEASDSSVVSIRVREPEGVLLVRAASQGEAVVSVSATDPGGLAVRQTFRVSVVNRGPVTREAIPEQRLYRHESVALEMGRYFGDPDRDTLTYRTETSESSVVTANVMNDTIIVTAIAQGRARLTVTATDPGGLSVTQRFWVTVPNRAPLPVDSIASRKLEVGDSEAVDLAPYFAEPDEDPLSYSVEVTDSAVVTVSVTDDRLTVTALAKGTVVVTVTASDPRALSAAQSFQVFVPNRAPMLTDSIPAHTLFRNDTVTVELARYFGDPDDDALAYTAVTSDSSVIDPRILSTNGAVLRVVALQQGRATVLVTASDTEGLTARQSFEVTVPNRGPLVTDSIPSQSLNRAHSVTLEMSRFFGDPDGDDLTYGAESSDGSVATVEVAGTEVTVTASGNGKAEVTVTAADPGGLAARQSFAVTVLNRSPAIADSIPPQTIFRGRPHALDMDIHFTDPDGDALTYEAVSSNRRSVQVEVDSSSLALRALRKGEAEVTVTATDPYSLTVEQTFTVTVGNQSPVAVATFPDLELGRGDRLTLPVDGYFTDPDRDALTYAASTSEPGIATATTRGNLVTVTALSDGLATLTLTAIDPDSLTATHTSRITVAGQGGNTPEPVGAIPAQTVAEGRDRTLVVSGYFEDPNGDPLTYGALTEDPDIATASVSGASVTITGVGSGETVLTVTATDPESHSASIRTPVTVVIQGQGPILVAQLPNQSVEVGQSITASVADHFQDPDGGGLVFDAVSSDPAIATAIASGSDITLTGVSEGRTTVTISANDSDGLSVSQSVLLTVEAVGNAPVAVGNIPAQSINRGGVAIFDAAPYFRDPEGADLTYDAGTLDATVATASATGSTVTVRGVTPGKTTLTVTATDPGGLSAVQSAEVDVLTPPRGPEAVGTIPDDSLMAGEKIEIDVTQYFSDPNGNPLRYTAGTSNAGIAIAGIVRNTLQVKGVGRGTATITVIASDPNGRTAVQRFSVLVTRIDTGFHIALGFADNVSAPLETAARNAGAYWTSILSATEFSDVVVDDTWSCSIFGVRFNVEIGTVDDLAIVVGTYNGSTGGTVAAAGACYVRSATGKPVLGVMVFDRADIGVLDATGNLSEVALHEIAHVLGFGLNRAWHDFRRDSVPGISGADAHFAGPLAIGAFDAAGGASYTGGKVPVENGDFKHWRGSVLDQELMVPTFSFGARHPLSAITILALGDMGYSVNAGLAEDYALPSLDIAGEMVDGARTIDLGDDIYRGPVIEIDEEGNVVRVVPGADGRVPGTPFRPGEAAARADSVIRITIDGRR